LRADLTLWSKSAEGSTQQRVEVQKILTHWKSDSDLSGLRDQEGLAKLPEEEQQMCRKLWAEVDLVLEKARKVKSGGE
jgi:hypothetical protein